MTRSRTATLGLMLAVSIGTAAPRPAAAVRQLRVGVLSDRPLGPPAERLLQQIEKEAGPVLGKGRQLQLPADKRRIANVTLDGATSGLNALLDDGGVDLVLVLGPISAAAAASHPSLRKPVLAPLTIDPALSGLPVTDEGRSGKKNFSYLVYLSSFSQDLEVFRELVEASVIHLIYDARLVEAIPQLKQSIEAVGKAVGVRLVGVPADPTAAGTLKRVPAEAKAVFVGSLLGMSPAERGKLLMGLQSRRLPSFTMVGREELEQGALATQTQAVDLLRIARRTARNIARVASGDDPARFSVQLRRSPRLMLNMAVARAIGFSPSWSTLTHAELLNEEAGAAQGGRSLSLGQAMKEALKRNLDLQAGRAGLMAGAQNIRAARSGVFPQLDFVFTHNTVREGVAEQSLGALPQHEGKVAGRLRQFLFIEPVLADITVQKKTQQARSADLETLKLDIVGETAAAYLNLLRSQTTAGIRRSNAMLTLENLELARVRRKVGVGGPSDVYRWESQLAVDRRLAIAARAEVRAALVRLNQLLQRPQTQPVAATAPDERDPTLLPRYQDLRPYMKTPRRFETFGNFAVKEGVEAAPELAQLEATLAARRRSFTSRSRALYLPQLEIQGEVSHQVYRDLTTDLDGVPLPFELDPPRFSWFIGAALALPLFTGMRQTAEKQREAFEVEQLEKQMESSKLKVESRIRTSLARSQSADFAIDLAAQSATAARKNLRVISDAYARGVANAVTLLDAQNNALASQLAEATATFDYLLSIVQLQRAGGRFELFVSAGERDAWFSRLREHFAAAGQPIGRPAQP